MVFSIGPHSHNLNIRYSTSKPVFLTKTSRIQQGSITLPGVSVITCTNRPYQIEALLANYRRQIYPYKELLIVLNSDSFDLDDLKLRTRENPDIKFLQLGDQMSLGECLNYSISQSGYDYIAKFDDDDYYAPKYLQSSILQSLHAKAGVIGKCSIYVYFKPSKTLYLLSPGNENTYTNSVRGATLIIKKDILGKVSFPPVNLGEDTGFIQKCSRAGVLIYSTSRLEYVSIRSDAKDHTWQLGEADFLSSFYSHQVIANNLQLVDVHKYISG
ncbi:MAG TPA: glycosyltransferase family A protein [Anaerovoracaceae bacterium]|nr:glycosyltransferase family A protein [Anaerovoracaceae bacterium]